MEKVRLGIIGYGQQGGFYGSLIAGGKVDGMVLGAIAEIDESVDAKIRGDFPDATIYRDYKEMIDSGDVDAIITTVPHYLHPEMATYALNNNIHVLNEKPAAGANEPTAPAIPAKTLIRTPIHNYYTFIHQ